MGHLCASYCVLYDRTGSRVFTVSTSHVFVFKLMAVFVMIFSFFIPDECAVLASGDISAVVVDCQVTRPSTMCRYQIVQSTQYACRILVNAPPLG